MRTKKRKGTNKTEAVNKKAPALLNKLLWEIAVDVFLLFRGKEKN